MKMGELAPPRGAKRNRKRVGRGPGSNQGKTAGKGTKGQKVRSGKGVAVGFEGGQTPLHRRLPKRRGISKGSMPLGMFRKDYAIVNVGRLEAFPPGTNVTPELLRKQRIIRKGRHGVRVLGAGTLTRPLTVAAHHFSASARQKIEAAGGTVEVL